MYFLYYISHLAFIGSLAVMGLVLLRNSFREPVRELSRRRYALFLALKWGVLGVFFVLLSFQVFKHFGRSSQLAEVQAIYDSRDWLTERRFPKGGIYDRSGRNDRAIALSVNDGSGLFLRQYPLSEASGHLAGYSDRSRGRSGIEAAFLPVLIGIESGHIENWRKAVKSFITSPLPYGNNVILTIDSRLQDFCHNALGGRRGAVVVLDPFSGEVLSLVSSPGFSPAAAADDSLWGRLADEKEAAPFFNRALQGRYAPGSVFKVLIAAAALEQGIDPEIRSGPEGFTPAGAGSPVHEHEFEEYSLKGIAWTGHGKLSMEKALRKSSNVYFAALSQQLGAESVVDMAENFGMNGNIEWNSAGEGLNIWFPTSVSEFPAAHRLNPEALAWSAIGQYKVLVTPLHMALMTAAIANGGDLLKPSLELGRYPKSVRKVMKEKTARELRDMMRKVVENGTGYRCKVPGLRIAGKTGTAETGKGQPHSWFVSFAPYNKPRIVVAVVIENGGYGGDAAAVTARKIYEAAKNYGYFK
ncbi:peptidoglycan D,D-transpeptidase FtsI family protein [candidate division KSB1 bacterium]